MKRNSYFSQCTKLQSNYLRKTFQNTVIEKNFLKRDPKAEGIVTIGLYKTARHSKGNNEQNEEPAVELKKNLFQIHI